MYFDGIRIAEGAELNVMLVPVGPELPGAPDQGELFFANGLGTATEGLYLYDGAVWAFVTNAYTPVNRAGDTMTGLLTLSADPTSALHAATKQYVDNYQHAATSIVGPGPINPALIGNITESQITDSTILARVGDAETITGSWSFSSPVTVATPTANGHATTKLYVDNLVGGVAGTPGGSDTQVQFNDSGAFGGDADFTWNKTTNVLTLGASGTHARIGSGTGYFLLKPTGSASGSLILEPTHSMNTTSIVAKAYDSVQGGTGSNTGDNHSISMSATGGAPSNYIHVEKYNTGFYSYYKSIAMGWGPATGLVSDGTAIYMEANTSTGALNQVVVGGTSADVTGAKLRVVGDLNITGQYKINGVAIGNSGYSGLSGYSGVGTSGYSGYSGVGTSGYSGVGLSGFSGYSGAPGIGGGGTPGGSDTQVQYNNAGAFGGSSDFTWNNTTKNLNVLGTLLGYAWYLYKDQVNSLEGGQIIFQRPTSTSLSADVTFDLYQNSIRIFTGGGQGAYIDLTTLASGTYGSRILTTADYSNSQTFSNTMTFSETVTFSKQSSGTTPTIKLTNATAKWIEFTASGVGAPAFTTRSAGTKINLWPGIGPSSVDYAIGIEGGTLWNSVTTTSEQFKWYGGTTQAMSLSGTGNLTTAGTLIGPAATTALASLRLPHGTAPSAPTDGDVWTTTGGLYVRVNGSTVGPLGTGGGGGTPGGSNKQLQYNNSSAFGGITGVEYDSATTTLSATGLATTTPFTAVTYGATTTINCRTGNLFRIAMTGNITTLTINNAADGQTINVVFVQDAVGARTVAWPASFVWVGQTTPILNVGANKIDILTAQYSSADSKWLCSLAIQDAPAPAGVTTGDVIALIMGLA